MAVGPRLRLGCIAVAIAGASLVVPASLLAEPAPTPTTEARATRGTKLPALNDGHKVARFALIIGNNQPESAETPRLRYADDDAIATHELLREAGIDTQLLVRIDEETKGLHPGAVSDGLPRLADLDRVFSALADRMRAYIARGIAVELLLFYSGHGDVDRGEGYVVMEDGHLTRTKLFELLARSPAARNHVVVDACKSYFLAFDRGPGGERAPYDGVLGRDPVPARLANTGFILSTSSDRESHEWERFQAGILSHELRSALRGAADADLDGVVTYRELGAFLVRANQAIVNRRYRPDFMVRPPSNEFRTELLAWKDHDSSGVLRIEATARAGHIYVETARGERLLDAHPADNRALLLHVPAERPLFVRRSDDSAEQEIARAPAPPITFLTVSRSGVIKRGALNLALEQLFALPFAPSEVEAFERRARTPDAGVTRAVPRAHWKSTLRWVAGSIAVAAAASAVASGGLALDRYFSGGHGSQVDIASSNHAVRRLDIFAAACLAVAGVAGVTWAGATWWRAGSPGVERGREGETIISFSREF